MRMRRPEGTEENQRWHRLLGRLHRTAESYSYVMRRSYRRPTVGRGQFPIPTGMDVGPTDPEVFRAQGRPPTPRPTENEYETPRPATAQPRARDLLQELLTELGEDVTTDADHIQHPQRSLESLDDLRPAHVTVTVRPREPSPRNSPPAQEPAYVEMDQGTPTGGRATPPEPSQSTSHDNPGYGYENLDEPQHRSHVPSERVIAIPQGSPPLTPPRQVSVPPYYRDYAHPSVAPAYHLVCHYAWFVQVTRDLIICDRCATDEHVFCSFNRPRAVWRHLHVLSRAFVHTSMHCGRCYRLMINTRRAIDCYTCRYDVIQTYENINRFTYRVVCETTIPRTAM